MALLIVQIYNINSNLHLAESSEHSLRYPIDNIYDWVFIFFCFRQKYIESWIEVESR